MVEPRHLPNAPIAEAIIDFRVKNTNVESLKNSLDRLKERIGSRYPKAQVCHDVKAAFQFRGIGLAEQSSTETDFQGYFFTSEDGLNIAQFRIDGFTFNRLKPYTSWDEILPEALNLWILYVEIAKPEYVARLGLRYINHIRLSLPVYDISKYLTALPSVPESTFYSLTGFLYRLLLAERKLKLEAAVTSALEASIEPNIAVVILDIDTFKQKEFSPNDDAAIRTTFNALREMKNTLFFGNITEDTVRLFNGR